MREPGAVLESIPGFAGARVAEQLSDGPTNNSYLVARDDGKYVLRLDKPEAARLGLDRHSEKEVIEVVAEAGLGQEPVYLDVSAGVYLRPFIPGRTWTKEDLEQAGNLERLAGLLRSLHALSPAGRIFEPLAAAARYAGQVGTAQANRAYAAAADACSRIEPFTPALCHNDLVCHNVLEGQGLTLIDWEYAGVGDPYFDLAVVVEHHGLEDGLARGFLAAYLGGEIQGEHWPRLQKQRRFYRQLLVLWKMRVIL